MFVTYYIPFCPVAGCIRAAACDTVGPKPETGRDRFVNGSEGGGKQGTIRSGLVYDGLCFS